MKFYALALFASLGWFLFVMESVFRQRMQTLLKAAWQREIDLGATIVKLTPMKRVCGWCGAVITDSADPNALTSHGICEPCGVKLMTQV